MLTKRPLPGKIIDDTELVKVGAGAGGSGHYNPLWVFTSKYTICLVNESGAAAGLATAPR